MILKRKLPRKRRSPEALAKVRRPTQAGAFYEGNAESLKQQIKQCFLHKFGPGQVPKAVITPTRHIVGLVCPHAGYMYSGPVASNAYYKLALDGKPDVVLILGPNHTGYGSALAIMSEGAWRTPLGDVEVDRETVDQIVREAHIVDVDESAHRFEHSIEVQLPWLQFLYGSSFKIVPVCFLMQDLSSAQEVGRTVGKVLSGKNSVIIASSDMTHYEPQDTAVKKDRMVMDALEAMDEVKLNSIIEAHNITACGYGPMMALIVASKILGAKEAKLLCYETSGDITGDYSAVVGYAAVCFAK